jgi:phosphatidylethanolamine-binding protein (PEBP) family uncharacterized protein
MKRIIAFGCFALLLPGCITSQDAANVASISVTVSWQGIPACSTVSPPFKLTNVPAGTKSFRFNMVDLDAVSYPHGGGTVNYTGNSDIPKGAFGYTGPCPPVGRHSYEWTVTAMDTNGTVVGRGKSVTPFP